MPASPGVAVVLAVNLLLFLAAIAAFVVVLRRTDPLTGGGDEPDAWYDQAASLAAEVEAAADDADAAVGRDRLQREIVPLATRLKSHARSAPRDVDDDLARRCHELGVDCYRVGMEHTERRAARTGVFVEDRLEELREAASALRTEASSRLG